MKKFLGFAALGILILGVLVFAILPNPFLQGGYTKGQWQKINEFYETETISQSITTSPKAISLDWFLAVDNIFQPFVDTRIFDLRTQKFFVVQRTGGQGHADVEPSSSYHSQVLSEITQKMPKTRLPVLVELSGMWVAASLSTTLHGFGLITNNGVSGHLCLHFENSKTDGTKRVDFLHQKTIKDALKMGQKIFPKNNQK